MKYEINHNFSGVPIGTTICYFIGNLAADKIERINGKFTDNALLLQTVSGIIYNRSCMDGCTKEFELKQVRLDFNVYAYLAKRIKPFD